MDLFLDENDKTAIKSLSPGRQVPGERATKGGIELINKRKRCASRPINRVRRISGRQLRLPRRYPSWVI